MCSVANVPPLRIVPVIDPTWSEATKAATSASSDSIGRRCKWVLLSIFARHWSRVMPSASACKPKTSSINGVSGIARVRMPTARIPCGPSSTEKLSIGVQL
jgi:hypothetical protein